MPFDCHYASDRDQLRVRKAGLPPLFPTINQKSWTQLLSRDRRTLSEGSRGFICVGEFE